MDRVSRLSAQDALLLLRVSFSAPRVQHLLRCSPSVDNPALDLFDGHLRSALSRITNTSLSDTQWLQASLPIKHGGLGIRQVRSLALPAFWLQPRAPRISSRRFCWHRPAPLTHSLTRTSQTGRLHMVPCLPQTLCRPSSQFGTNQAFCPPVLPVSYTHLTLPTIYSV